MQEFRQGVRQGFYLGFEIFIPYRNRIKTHGIAGNRCGQQATVVRIEVSAVRGDGKHFFGALFRKFLILITMDHLYTHQFNHHGSGKKEKASGDDVQTGQYVLLCNGQLVFFCYHHYFFWRSFRRIQSVYFEGLHDS